MKPTSSLQSLFPTGQEIPVSMRLKEPIHQRRLLVNGTLLHWEGPTQAIYSPIFIRDTSGKILPTFLGSSPMCGASDAFQALKAAVDAFDGGKGEWPSMTIHERIKRIWVLIRHMIRRKSDIVKRIVWETGKAVSAADAEFEQTIASILEMISALKKSSVDTSAYSRQEGTIIQLKKVPQGVVLCLGAFLNPLQDLFALVIPALLMGNTLIVKLSKGGVLFFEPILEGFATAFPKGVVNTLYGRGRDMLPLLMQSGQVDMLAMCGPRAFADDLRKMHPSSNRLPILVGMEGKNIAFIFSDAAIDVAVKECIRGGLTYNGQRQSSLSVLFVHEHVVDVFNNRLVEEVDKLRIGMPWTSGVTITPLAKPYQPDYLRACIQDALDHGATILNHGHDPGLVTGSFIKPTILYPVNETMLVYREQQFGPLLPIVPFDDFRKPLDYIKQSPNAHQVNLFSQNPSTLQEIVHQLAGQVSNIAINSHGYGYTNTLLFSNQTCSEEPLAGVDILAAFSRSTVVTLPDTPFNETIMDEVLSTSEFNKVDH